MNSLNFNIDNGYLEGLVRGFKAGILKQSDYANLVQCETLEGKYIRRMSKIRLLPIQRWRSTAIKNVTKLFRQALKF